MEKRRKCWLPAFSPFPTMFSKVSFSRSVKSGLCGEGLSSFVCCFGKNKGLTTTPEWCKPKVRLHRIRALPAFSSFQTAFSEEDFIMVI